MHKPTITPSHSKIDFEPKVPKPHSTPYTTTIHLSQERKLQQSLISITMSNSSTITFAVNSGVDNTYLQTLYTMGITIMTLTPEKSVYPVPILQTAKSNLINLMNSNTNCQKQTRHYSPYQHPQKLQLTVQILCVLFYHPQKNHSILQTILRP